MNNKNDFLANSSNRSIQMDSISNALVSRLASVEKKYKMCLSSMHTKEYSIRVLKNEIYNCICDDSDDISSNQNNNILEQAESESQNRDDWLQALDLILHNKERNVYSIISKTSTTL